MEVRPGYKRTEIGVIPDDWKVRQLAQVSRKITDGDHVTPKRASDGYFLLSARNVLNGRIDLSNVDHVCAAEYQRMKQRCGPECGDILISCSGTIGRVSVVPPDLECVLVRSAALVKLDRQLADGRFLQFWLQGRQAQAQIASSVNQGAQPNLFLNQIERLACPDPPLLEQRAIAVALSDADALLDGLDRLIAKKRDLKQAAMQQLLTGQARLPGFHGEWEVKRLGTELTICHGKSQRDVEAADGPYPILATGGQIGRASQPLYDKPSVLIGRKGTINKPQYMDTPFWTVDTLFFSEMKGGNSARFFYYLFCTIDWMQFNEASGVPSLNARTIERIEIDCPEPTEQTAIAAVLSDMDAELAALEARRYKTRLLKQAMMQELLTGRTRLV